MYRLALRQHVARAAAGASTMAAGSSLSLHPRAATAKRAYQPATGQSRIERQVETGGAPAGGPVAGGGGQQSDAQIKAAMESVDPTRIEKMAVWSLWNEGNLFSLSVPELAAFLSKEDVEPKALRKSALVRQVEDVMNNFAPPTTNPTDDSVASITASLASGADEFAESATEIFDEADDYGDWGADPSFEDRRGVDFMALAHAMHRTKDMKRAHLASHAFQLLHEEASSDIALGSFNASKLPGCEKISDAFGAVNVVVEDANKLAFRKAFQWSANSLWNLGLDGEINIGAGKALYRREVAKRNRSVLPTWTCQEHLNSAYPYTWFAVAHESNVSVMEKLATDMGMTPNQDAAETSYKVTIHRTRDVLDVELNPELQPTLINKPWERIYMCHYLRSRLPDLRYLVRARRAIKKKVVETYLDSRYIQIANDTAQSVLSPELGEINYCCERLKRRWTTQLDSGVTLSIVETRRTPLIVEREGDDGERLEYELIANIPQQVERVDLHALADDLWDRGTQMAVLLEEGMAEFQAHTMSSSAAFEVAARV